MKKTDAGGSTVYVGGHYEKNLATGVATEYYYAGGRRIALRQGEQVYYLLGDHLGGTWATVKPGGVDLQHSLYSAFGGPRNSVSNLPTDKLFAGYRLDTNTGIYQVGSRYYDPSLGRFLQPDPMGQAALNDAAPYMPLTVSYSDPAIISQLAQWNLSEKKGPAPVDPQLLNRYSYSRNNPTTYYDPTGKFVWAIAGALVGGTIGATAYYFSHRDNFDANEALTWAAGGAVVGSGVGILGGALGGGGLAVGAASTVLVGSGTRLSQSTLQAISSRNGGGSPILGAATDKSGRLLAWLEQGYDQATAVALGKKGPAGWAHIVEDHIAGVNQFAGKFGHLYRDESAIQKLILQAAEALGGKSGLYQVPGTDAFLRVVIGSNGFIVTAHPD